MTCWGQSGRREDLDLYWVNLLDYIISNRRDGGIPVGTTIAGESAKVRVCLDTDPGKHSKDGRLGNLY